MDEQPGLAERSRDEAVIQVIGLAVLIIGGIVLQIAQRKAADPDAVRQVKMRAAKGLERFAATAAAEWWKVAERARLLYESERP